MSAWNAKFSEKWVSNKGESLSDKLVKTSTEKNAVSDLPKIESLKNSGADILQERAKDILIKGFAEFAVNLNYIQAYSKKSYVIAYLPEEIYKEGHVQHAVLYNPGTAFSLKTDLKTLPTDKTLIVYSLSAHQSTMICVFLNLLGYDAKTLKYGASGFMNDILNKHNTGFKSGEINNFPIETSVYIEVEEKTAVGGC